MGDRMDDARELLATLRTSIGDWTWHLPLARVERAFLKVTERVADAEAEAARRTDAQVAIAEALGLRSDATGVEIVEAAATERAQREAAEGECARLRAMLDDVADAHERDVLAVWEALGNDHEPPASMANVVHAAETTLGAARVARDAAVAQREALAGAVRRERATRAAWLATLPPCATAPAEVLAAEAATGAALDALPTEGTRSVADEAECDDCGDDMASGYFDPMARCPRHRP